MVANGEKTAPKISALVPAYNEEKNIVTIVQSLLSHPLIDEVIAISDGSTDSTLDKLRRFSHKIAIISLKKNHGKGYALSKGIEKARGDIVCFFDADLRNLSGSHITQILTPLLNRTAEAVIGCKKKHWYDPKWFENIAGERAYYKKDLIPLLSTMQTTGFGVEMYLNYAFAGKRILKIRFRDLDHIYKHKKHTAQEAFLGSIKEIAEVALVIGKQEHIFTNDYAILAKLLSVKTKAQLNQTIAQLQNKRLRQIIEKYIIGSSMTAGEKLKKSFKILKYHLSQPI